MPAEAIDTLREEFVRGNNPLDCLQIKDVSESQDEKVQDVE